MSDGIELQSKEVRGYLQRNCEEEREKGSVTIDSSPRDRLCCQQTGCQLVSKRVEY